MVRWHRFHCADTSTSIQRERKWEKEWASESNENWCWSWNLYSVCARAIAERNKANKIIADWARNIYPKCLSWCRISFVYSRPCCYNDTRRLYHPIVPRICTVEIPNRFGRVITQSPKKIIIAIRSWRFLCLYIWLCMAKKNVCRMLLLLSKLMIFDWVCRIQATFQAKCNFLLFLSLSLPRSRHIHFTIFVLV